MWHPISTAPFDRDLELAIIDSNGVRAIAYPCSRVLGGWIKAEIKTRVELRPTHWRDWSTDAKVKRPPFLLAVLTASCVCRKGPRRGKRTHRSAAR
jgi:hypothetical protein